jgi:ABC-type transport system involved in cytochrome c biogenesis permease subunit
MVYLQSLSSADDKCVIDFHSVGDLIIVNDNRLQTIRSFVKSDLIKRNQSSCLYNYSIRELTEIVFGGNSISVPDTFIFKIFPSTLWCKNHKFLENTLRILKRAYNEKNIAEFNYQIDKLVLWENKSLCKFTLFRIYLENIYIIIPFMGILKLLFIICSLLYIYFLVKNKFLMNMHLVTLILFTLFSILLLIKTVILIRPPVASLYETFVLTAWIFSGAGVLISKKIKEDIISLISICVSTLFLLLSGLFGGEMKSMTTVSAVLNSNLWLSIHIITIICGYAGFVMASIFSRIYLIKCAIKSTGMHILTVKKINNCIGVALLFTLLGTALGGLWADLSWGRFWGWDPKECGALLIIVWGALLLHGHKGNIIKEKLLVCGTTFSSAIVLYTWIGVNLMGKGMHSYGFTNSGIYLLLGYLSFEVIFISIIFILKRRSHNQCISRPAEKLNRVLI